MVREKHWKQGPEISIPILPQYSVWATAVPGRCCSVFLFSFEVVHPVHTPAIPGITTDTSCCSCSFYFFYLFLAFESRAAVPTNVHAGYRSTGRVVGQESPEYRFYARRELRSRYYGLCLLCLHTLGCRQRTEATLTVIDGKESNNCPPVSGSHIPCWKGSTRAIKPMFSVL